VDFGRESRADCATHFPKRNRRKDRNANRGGTQRRGCADTIGALGQNRRGYAPLGKRQFDEMGGVLAILRKEECTGVSVLNKTVK
jgi:hypothetical protein